MKLKSLFNRFLPTLFPAFRARFPELYKGYEDEGELPENIYYEEGEGKNIVGDIASTLFSDSEEEESEDEESETEEEHQSKSGINTIKSMVGEAKTAYSHTKMRVSPVRIFIFALYYCIPTFLTSLIGGVLIGTSLLCLHTAKFRTTSPTIDHMLFILGLTTHILITSAVLFVYEPIVGIFYMASGGVLIVVSVYDLKDFI